MCGILGILDPDKGVSADLYRGAMALQHRGQDGAGLATFEGRFFHRSGVGLFADVFRGEELPSYRGHFGLAHLRYATAGVGGDEECQPFLLSYPFGLGLIHNGNLTNDQDLRAHLEASGHRHVNSRSDSETLLHVFADALSHEDLGNLSPTAIMRATRQTMGLLEGAYSVVILIANHGLLAFRDPKGIRPLVMGRRDRATVFASESVAIDAVEAELLRDVYPGEAVFVDLQGQVHCRQLFDPEPAHCAFEYVYLARPESIIDGRSVSDVREALGDALAARFCPPQAPDVVFDVPSSAEDAAVAFARRSGVPYRKGIRKNQYVQRSFIGKNRSVRQGTVGMKFLFERRVIDGKRVAVIDDSIVRGTTARTLIARLRQHGAKKVYFMSAAPQIKHPCVYGIDMSVRRDLIAANLNTEAVASYLGVDHLEFQTLGDLGTCIGPLRLCTACFDGCYPTQVDARTAATLESERASVSGHGPAPTSSAAPVGAGA